MTKDQKHKIPLIQSVRLVTQNG